MQWEILHVPEKPPSSLEQSTVDVFATTIEPKLANSFVRQLNQICPLENLRHVKRVRRRSTEGKIELSVILCLSLDLENRVEGIPNDVLQLVNAYQLSPFVAKVAKYAASSKEEWETQCKLWPTSYHPPTSLDSIVGFSEEDSQLIFNYMKTAIRLAKSSYLGDKVANAAVIVDPLRGQIIASATDQTCSRPTATNKSSSKNISCIEQEKVIASPQSDANGLTRNGCSLPKVFPDEFTRSYTGVPCLYPWRWAEQRPYGQNSEKCESNYSWHPLRHAALVAIENAAARDRQLFPSQGSLEYQSIQADENLQPSFISFPAKRKKTQIAENEGNLVKQVCTNDSSSEAMKPYLCTGFDIYLVWEPCTMCAMALVHQRIRRIFYAYPNPHAGALGSIHRLQGERSLNHHYSVFRILLPEKALDEVELTGSDNCLLQD